MSTPEPAPPSRLTSIDAYRGLVMFLIAAESLALGAVLDNLHQSGRQSALLQLLLHQQTHVEWVGCVLHDMIQPSFSMLVGVVLPFSIAARRARGQSLPGMTAHAFLRALILVFLGVFLRSLDSSQTNFTFEDTLSQIGLGYGLLFLLGFVRPATSGSRWRRSSSAIGRHSPSIRWPARTSTTPGWASRPSGSSAWAVGLRRPLAKEQQPRLGLRHLVPESLPAGKALPLQRRRLRHAELHSDAGDDDPGTACRRRASRRADRRGKVRWLVVAGAAMLAGGWLLGWLGVCPVVKRIWTPSWVLYAGGVSYLMLAGFYAVMEIGGLRTWAFPLVVIGSNSIAAYCMIQVFLEYNHHFIHEALVRHLPAGFFTAFGGGLPAAGAGGQRARGDVADPAMDVSQGIFLRI